MNEEAIIRVLGLYKKYDKSTKNALNGIDLEIQKGEVFGLLGPNGAGKTTFFSSLCGLLTPSLGNVFVNGQSIDNELSKIKSILGVVPQEIALYPTISGRDNLMFIGRMYGLRGKDLSKRVDECLDDFGFEKNRHLAVKKYSGGMKRRINLIGGILHYPKVLLLDEPTVGIDVQSRISILEHLKRINAELGTTIIYTSHHIEEAQHFCDRVAILDEGNIVIKGVSKEMMANENCASLEEVFIKLTGKAIRD